MSNPITSSIPEYTMGEVCLDLPHRIYIRAKTILVGDPGIGKTALIEQLAASMTADSINNYLAKRDPSIAERPFTSVQFTIQNPATSDATFTGMAMPNHDDLRLDYYLARWLPKPSDDPSIRPFNIILIDEFNRAPHIVLATMLSAMQSGHVNGHSLADIAWVACGNHPNNDADAEVIGSAFANRGSVYYVKPDADSWLDWALDHSIHPLLQAFVRKSPSQLHDFSQYSAYPAFPTPRSLANFSRETLTDPDFSFNDISTLQRRALTTCGPAFASEFCKFVRIHDRLPDPNAILSNPDTHPLPDPAPEILYTTIYALASRIREIPVADQLPAIRAYLRYMHRFTKEHRELGIVGLRLAYRIPANPATLISLPEMTPILNDYSNLLNFQ